jgi:Ca2+-binding EF-hand superfamily protein
LKQDVGNCPCCRKEMTAIEDLPRDDDSEVSSIDSEDEEVEMTRTELQAFITSLGGNLSEEAADNICEVIAGFTYYELNALVVGNTGRPLTEDRWNELLEEDDEDEDLDSVEDEEDVWNLRIVASFDADGSTREISMVTTEDAATAATKLQAVWRGFKGRVAVMEKRAINILATMRT